MSYAGLKGQIQWRNRRIETSVPYNYPLRGRLTCTTLASVSLGHHIVMIIYRARGRVLSLCASDKSTRSNNALCDVLRFLFARYGGVKATNCSVPKEGSAQERNEVATTPHL